MCSLSICRATFTKSLYRNNRCLRTTSKFLHIRSSEVSCCLFRFFSNHKLSVDPQLVDFVKTSEKAAKLLSRTTDIRVIFGVTSYNQEKLLQCTNQLICGIVGMSEHLIIRFRFRFIVLVTRRLKIKKLSRTKQYSTRHEMK